MDGGLVINLAYMFGGKPRLKICNELSDLAAFRSFLGLSEAEAKKIWWYNYRMYHHFDISKKSGKPRTISAPDDRLKSLQRRIAKLLQPTYVVKNSVHGFVPDRSVKTNAECHERSKYVVNIDLKDFFPSINEKRVVGLLVSVGVDNAVAQLIGRITCVKGWLPQGAPTSPLISNMICFRLDRELFHFAKSARCIYTRYADDITFSSFQPPSALFEGSTPESGNFDPEILSKKLSSIVLDNGFAINPDKSHYASRASRQIVTGIKVNDGLNLDRKYIRNIGAMLYNVQRHGVEATKEVMASKYGISTNIAFHLHGKINWVGHVKGRSDPVYRRLATRFNALFDGPTIKVQPTPAEIRDRSIWVINDVDEDENEGIQGTAFFLRGVGLITAAHCVPADQEYTIFHPSRPANKFSVKVKSRCDHRDLAVLEHQISETEYYELDVSPSAAAVEDEVLAAGYPNYGPGDQVNLRSGTVSSLIVRRAVKLMEVTQKLTQGMSGGPILNSEGSVVGIIHKGGPLEGRDFGVRIEVLSEMLAQ